MTEAISLEADDLKKSYGPVEAVRGISFRVHPGEIVGLLGPNGAGKTTTLEIAQGLRPPDSGRVRVFGLDPIHDAKEVRQRMGGQLQEVALPDKMKVKEALAVFASYYRRREDPSRLLERLSLGEKRDATFDTLSGGQRQRLALALALVHRPEIVFLDEPTAGLDAQVRNELHGILRELRDEGRSLVLTTHYIEEAARLCDRVLIVDHGRVIAEGTPRELAGQASSTARVEFSAEPAPSTAGLASIPDVSAIESRDGLTVLRTAHPAATIVSLVRLLEHERCELTDLHIAKPSLEDLFLERTGRRIRDA